MGHINNDLDHADDSPPGRASRNEARPSWRTAGYLHIEGGVVLITDPATAAERPEELWDEVLSVSEELFADLSPQGIRAVVVSTGFGDGTYPVEVGVVEDSDGSLRVEEIRIRF